MERKDNNGVNSKSSVLSEVFAATSNGQNSGSQAQALRQLHVRLSSPDFVDRMTDIFFRAKRAALTSSK